MNEFTVSNALLAEPEALRARARQDGYLFFRSLVPPEPLRNVRRQILALCAEAGWLAPDSDPEDGIARPGVRYVEGEPIFNDVYYKQVIKLEDFHALAHEPALLKMLDTLFGEPTLVHARNIARIIFPQATAFTTPAHQDFIHIQGTEETWTAWIPLSDCPQSLGGLAVLSGSHRGGVLPVHPALGAGGFGIETDALPFQWVTSDFNLGDVLIFHSLVVHKGLPNVTADRMRVSVDFRYQGVSQPITDGSLYPHGGAVSWDEVYAGWRSDRLKYYWRDLPLQRVEWSSRYHDAGRADDQEPVKTG